LVPKSLPLNNTHARTRRLAHARAHMHAHTHTHTHTHRGNWFQRHRYKNMHKELHKTTKALRCNENGRLESKCVAVTELSYLLC